MYILGFDTSNAYSSVSISNGSNIIYAEKNYVANSQAEKLVLMIEKALEKADITYQDLEYLAVSAGPGSFTGIRIALATAKAILLASPAIKPVCVNNFDLILFRIRQQILNYDFAIACINAFRDEIYLQVFPKKMEVNGPLLLSSSDTKKLIESLEGNVILAGSGLNQIYNTEHMPPENIRLLPRFAYPDARYVCRVAHQHIVQNRQNPVITPLYIREADAKLPQNTISL